MQLPKRNLKVGYTPETVRIAIERIRSGELSMGAAGRMYSIPKSTLSDKINGITPIESTQGPNPFLNRAEEGRLVEWLKHMAQIGYGRTKHELKLTVKKIVESDGRKTPFAGNMPGRQWLRNFMKRHPDLSVRRPESLGIERATVTKEKISQWFHEYKAFMKDAGIEDVISDPSRLFNVDETGFPLGVKNERVLTARGARNVYQQTLTTSQQITVVGACNAAGSYIPPLIIFPGLRFGYNALEGAPDHSSFAKSKTGYINSEIFFEYLSNHFLPYVKSLHVYFPIVLFVDGHSAHLNIDTAEFCVKEKIILYCLPSHSSHLMQPLDVAVYKSLKTSWNKAVRKWMTDHYGQYVTKQSFSSVFAVAWEESAKKKYARSGFRKSGLYPFNANAIDPAMLAPSTVFHRTEQPTTATTVSSTSMPLQTPPSSSPQSLPPPSSLPLPPPSSQTLSPPPSLNQSAGSTSSTPTSSTPPSSSFAANVAALHALESAMGEVIVSNFQSRQMEGCDMSDPMYYTWFKLKSSTTIVTPPPSSMGKHSNSYVSPAFDEHLVYPKRAMASENKRVLPHVISGKAYIKMLKEKEEKKKEVEAAKAERKRVREEKKTKNKKKIIT
ncbi:uncharacterized protein [Antedon mediterranea]|uniref:uncharacterized protein n=1 Tax=Antedon mediterranea TaxID=105859 RepID=UPI003AF62C1C